MIQRARVELADRRHVNDDGPTQASIERALAIQAQERAVFTQRTGVLLRNDGRMLRRSYNEALDN